MHLFDIKRTWSSCSWGKGQKGTGWGVGSASEGRPPTGGPKKARVRLRLDDRLRYLCSPLDDENISHWDDMIAATNEGLDRNRNWHCVEETWETWLTLVPVVVNHVTIPCRDLCGTVRFVPTNWCNMFRKSLEVILTMVSLECIQTSTL